MYFLDLRLVGEDPPVTYRRQLDKLTAKLNWMPEDEKNSLAETYRQGLPGQAIAAIMFLYIAERSCFEKLAECIYSVAISTAEQLEAKVVLGQRPRDTNAVGIRTYATRLLYWQTKACMNEVNDLEAILTYVDAVLVFIHLYRCSLDDEDVSVFSDAPLRRWLRDCELPLLELHQVQGAALH